MEEDVEYHSIGGFNLNKVNEIYQQIIDRKKNGGDYSELYKKLTGLDISPDVARKYIKGAEDILSSIIECESDKIDDITDTYKSSSEITHDGKYKSDKLLKINDEQKKDPCFLLDAHGFSIDNWELLSVRNDIWNVYSKLDGVQQLYSSKIVAKPRIKDFDLSWFEDTFRNIKPHRVLDKKVPKTGIVSEIQLADLHIGLHGYEYEEQLKNMIDDIILSCIGSEHIVIPIGQDFLNCNSVEGTNHKTVKGTSLEQKLSYEDMFEAGIRILTHLISGLYESCEATIECIYVPGNHDEHSCYGLFHAIKSYFRKCKNISFDSSIEPRKYRQYGINGIGFGHGQSEKKNIEGLFQTESPFIFAGTKTREFHLSHLHHETVKDKNGVVFRRLPTVNSEDNYHKTHGYIGSNKRVQVFKWNKRIGLDSIEYYNIH